MIKLRNLTPDSYGLVVFKTGNKNAFKSNGTIEYDTAVAYVKEGRAVVVSKYTILIFKSKDQVKKHVKERDKYICHYCKGYGNTIDHVIPRAKGGLHTPANLVCCCYECNQKKKDMAYKEFINSFKNK